MKAWRHRSEDAGTISLHDCTLSGIRRDGERCILLFEEGFDVERENAENPTGRHRRTGPSAISLEKCSGLRGELDPCCLREETFSRRHVPLTWDLLCEQSGLVLLDYSWDGRRVDVSGINTACEYGYFALSLAYERATFCWDELLRDAWFQD